MFFHFSELALEWAAVREYPRVAIAAAPLKLLRTRAEPAPTVSYGVRAGLSLGLDAFGK